MLPVFITNNHIIDNNLLKLKDAKIKIDTKEETEIKEIKLKDRIVYTNEEYDITIIEIKDNDNIKNYLELDDNIIDDILNDCNKNKEYINDTIYIIHYCENKLSVSYGIFYDIYNDEKKYNFYHKCKTKEGSSGSPILNLDNKLIGIHKEGCLKNQFNIGLFINYPIKDFIKINCNKNENKINGINNEYNKLIKKRSKSEKQRKRIQKKIGFLYDSYDFNSKIRENFDLIKTESKLIKDNDNDKSLFKNNQNQKSKENSTKKTKVKIDNNYIKYDSNKIQDKQNIIMKNKIKSVNSDSLINITPINNKNQMLINNYQNFNEGINGNFKQQNFISMNNMNNNEINWTPKGMAPNNKINNYHKNNDYNINEENRNKSAGRVLPNKLIKNFDTNHYNISNNNIVCEKNLNLNKSFISNRSIQRNNPLIQNGIKKINDNFTTLNNFLQYNAFDNNLSNNMINNNPIQQFNMNSYNYLNNNNYNSINMNNNNILNNNNFNNFNNNKNYFDNNNYKNILYNNSNMNCNNNILYNYNNYNNNIFYNIITIILI